MQKSEMGRPKTRIKEGFGAHMLEKSDQTADDAENEKDSKCEIWMDRELAEKRAVVIFPAFGELSVLERKIAGNHT